MPPGVKRPNAFAAIGAPAAQAAKEKKSAFAQRLPSRSAGRTARISASITVNESRQPTSATIRGSARYTARKVSDQARSASGRRQNTGASR